MARKQMTAKQIRFFGTKRQKAALKARRSGARHTPATKHRANTAARKSSGAHKHRASKTGGARKRTSNPGEIISFALGNPAHRKGSTMATKTKKKHYKKSSGASRGNAGRRASKQGMGGHHRPKRKNPAGLGKPMDWVKGGFGVLGGMVGARAIPQLAGASNTGAMGYVMNFGVAIGLGLLSHVAFKDMVITAAVIGGGVAATIARIVTDQTQYGQYLALTGVGDYIVWNFSAPQRVTGKNASRIDTAWRMDAAQPQDAMMAGDLNRFRG